MLFFRLINSHANIHSIYARMFSESQYTLKKIKSGEIQGIFEEDTYIIGYMDKASS